MHTLFLGHPCRRDRHDSNRNLPQPIYALWGRHSFQLFSSVCWIHFFLFQHQFRYYILIRGRRCRSYKLGWSCWFSCRTASISLFFFFYFRETHIFFIRCLHLVFVYNLFSFFSCISTALIDMRLHVCWRGRNKSKRTRVTTTTVLVRLFDLLMPDGQSMFDFTIWYNK